MIDDLAVEYPIQELSAAYEVSTSGFYQWKHGSAQPSPRAQQNANVVAEMKKVHARKYSRYGSPKMTRLLHQRGHAVNHKRVARLMRENHLRGHTRRAFRPHTTDSAHGNPVAPNRLAQIPEIAAPNQVWVSDITYIATREGWLYLAAVMDLFSRCIVGWCIRETLQSDLVIRAHELALRKRGPGPGLVCHSDRGVQYTSQDHRRLIEGSGHVLSMSRKGNCYDNAAMESLWSLLKSEALPESGVFETKAQAKLEIFQYIEAFFNRERLHSALGYKSPIDFEAQNK